MSDLVPETTPTPTPATPPAVNTPEARTETGELKSATSTTPSTETTPETKTPEDKTKPEATTGAPEAYADFTAPEGYTIDKATIEKALPIFKELNLSQDAAQKLVEFYATTQLQGAKAGETAYNTMRETWRGETLKDTSLATGNDLKPEVKQGIGRTIDSLGPELAKQFRETMDLTGVGDNPTFVKAIYQFSKFVTEGRPVQPGGPSPAGQVSPDAKPKSIASAMYPKLA